MRRPPPIGSGRPDGCGPGGGPRGCPPHHHHHPFHHRHRHGARWHPRSLLVWYTHVGLRLRLFRWFAAAILLSGLAVAAVLRLTGQWGDRSPPHAWPWILVTLAVVVVLWIVAGGVSWRLARPFATLARVAEDLGAGRFDTRVRIGPHDGGETRVLARVLNEMAERIERQIADHRELLAAVSHELRTPLARIRLLVELGRTGDGGTGTLEEIDREVVEMDALVDQLLVNSRLDFQTLSKRPLSAEAVAKRALERAGLPETMLESRANGVEVEGDATLLGRALANLLDNAHRHGGGLERLCVEATDDEVRFIAKDSGEGFAADEAARVFEPFFRGAPKDGESRGTLGLGLALVRRIAKAHGGDAFARNRPDGGAEVGFEVPPHRPRTEA